MGAGFEGLQRLFPKPLETLSARSSPPGSPRWVWLQPLSTVATQFWRPGSNPGCARLTQDNPERCALNPQFACSGVLLQVTGMNA